MAKVINLGKVRKRKQREAAQRQADANAIAHGRTKEDGARARAERQKLEQQLDGARLEGEPPAREDD